MGYQANSFGNMIYNQRRKLKLTVRDLAKDAGVSFAYISSLENNRSNKVPSGEVIKRLSEALFIDFKVLQEAACKISKDEKSLLRTIPREDLRHIEIYYRLRKRFTDKQFQTIIKKMEEEDLLVW